MQKLWNDHLLLGAILAVIAFQTCAAYYFIGFVHLPMNTQWGKAIDFLLTLPAAIIFYIGSFTNPYTIIIGLAVAFILVWIFNVLMIKMIKRIINKYISK